MHIRYDNFSQNNGLRFPFEEAFARRSFSIFHPAVSVSQHVDYVDLVAMSTVDESGIT